MPDDQALADKPANASHRDLSDLDKFAIEQYLKEIRKEDEERRHKQTLRYTAIAGVFMASLSALLAWALSSVLSMAEQKAKEPFDQSYKDALIDARISAKRAEQEAEDAESELKRIKQMLTQTRDVMDVVKDIDTFVEKITTKPGFQDAITSKILPYVDVKQITLDKRLSDVERKTNFINVVPNQFEIDVGKAHYWFPYNGNFAFGFDGGIICGAANDRSRPNSADLVECFH
jgi:hypothetical protein